MAVHALFPGHVFSGSVLDQLKSACGRRTAHPWATPAMLSSPLVISAYWQDERKAVGGNVREEAGGNSGSEDRKRLASRLGRARERVPGRLQNTSTAESVHFFVAVSIVGFWLLRFCSDSASTRERGLQGLSMWLPNSTRR